MSRDAVLVLVLVLALLGIGVVMLYSATGIAAEQSPRHQDSAYFLKRQLGWMAIAVLAMLAVWRVPVETWARWRWPILAGTLALLGMVFVPGLGVELNAARRWVRLGGWFLQPSEAAKVGLAVFLSAFAGKDPERLQRFFTGFLPAALAIGVVCGLILIEPDVGTAIFIAMVSGLLLFTAGVRLVHALPVAVTAAGFMAFYALSHTEHVQRRLDTWGNSYQVTQALIALGSGGWTGRGLGQGMSKLYYLPEVHSDFIFPVIGEELGFVGASAVVLLYAAFGMMGLRIALRAPSRFTFLLSIALTSYIILQAAINVAVATAAVPTKGIPLPFVSAGGSSLLFTMMAVGMLLGVATAAERGRCQEGEGGSCSPEGAPAAMSFRD